MQPESRPNPSVWSRAVILAFSSLIALGASPSPLTGQTYWRVPGALGGAFVGAGAGWIVDVARAAGRDQLGVDLVMTPAGIGFGGLLGFLGGLSADRRLARGDSLTRGGRAVLRTATFLAPLATGTAIAFAIINPSDDDSCVPAPDPNLGCTYQPSTKSVSDETVALVAIGGGAVIGFVAQRKFARALWPKARVGLAPDGRGVMVSIPAGW